MKTQLYACPKTDCTNYKYTLYGDGFCTQCGTKMAPTKPQKTCEHDEQIHPGKFCGQCGVPVNQEIEFI